MQNWCMLYISLLCDSLHRELVSAHQSIFLSQPPRYALLASEWLILELVYSVWPVKTCLLGSIIYCSVLVYNRHLIFIRRITKNRVPVFILTYSRTTLRILQFVTWGYDYILMAQDITIIEIRVLQVSDYATGMLSYYTFLIKIISLILIFLSRQACSRWVEHDWGTPLGVPQYNRRWWLLLHKSWGRSFR